MKQRIIFPYILLLLLLLMVVSVFSGTADNVSDVTGSINTITSNGYESLNPDMQVHGSDPLGTSSTSTYVKAPDIQEQEIPDADNLTSSQQKLSTALLMQTVQSSPETSSNDISVADSLMIKNVPSRFFSKVSSTSMNIVPSGELVYVYVSVYPEYSTFIIDPYVPEVTGRDEENHLAVAWVDIQNLQIIADLEGVRKIREVIPPVVNMGSVTTQGDAIHKTANVRTTYGYKGAGMKIGIISDGVDHISDSKASGDLPADVVVLSNTQGGDEGTAILEIVYDMVPDAKLYFHDCGDSNVAFNAAIDELKANGCTVICDDISWFDEAYFEDGTIASHVGSVLSGNQIVYVSSAGNFADGGYYIGHYQGGFFDRGDGYHDFSRGTDATDKDLHVRLPPGSRIDIFLQWDDQFGYSGNDYNLYLKFNSGELSSDEVQTGTGDPYEYLPVVNNGASTVECIIGVKKKSGVSKTLELYVKPNNGAILYYNNLVASDSIFGHPAVPDVIAVAAVDQATPSTIESFSSRGPVTIAYPSAVSRSKPDISGVDKVSITGAGGFPDSSKIFGGTSASAPHIAAIVAQIWGANPTLTPAQVRNALYSSAVDLGTAGKDTTYGYGRADALAMANLYKPPASITSLINTTYQPSYITWTWTDPTSTDFSKVMVYLDGVFKTNVTKGVRTYTASSLTPDTGHTIATRTVGTTGLVNPVWVNSTARTAPVPPVEPVSPGSITDLRNTTYLPASIMWAWTDPTSADFDKVMVYLNGVFQSNVTKGSQTFTANGLNPSSLYTIGTHTVGTTGLINLTWVNSTAKTAPNSASTGLISIQSNPTGAKIFLDGTDTGYVTPKTISDIPVGSHVILCRLNGYADNSQMVSVLVGQTATVSIDLVSAPSTGSVFIQSSPTGAKIYLDYADTGFVTPKTIPNLATGNHVIRCSLSGYDDTTQTVSVVSGQTADVMITLQKPATVAPKPDFSASTREGGSPLIVQFTDKSANLPTAWTWTFGDGSTSNEQNPKYMYVKAGSYSVKLKVSNLKGTNGLTRSGYITVTGSTPSNGSISIESSPAGAKIYLDNADTGFVTPKTILNVPVGSHVIRCSLTGYTDNSKTVSVSEGQTTVVSIDLVSAPGTGSISIESSPTDAKIYLDNADTGFVTPKIISNVPAGSHVIRCSLTGYTDNSKTVSVPEGQTATVNIDLVSIPSNGSISIESSPTGAKIYLDNADTGFVTPKTISNVPVGSHVIRCSLTGYTDNSKTVSVSEGQTTVVSIDLVSAPGTGSISIESSPAGAKIYLDNADTGFVTPKIISNVPAGSHVIHCSLTGYTDNSQTVFVVSGQTSDLVITLQKQGTVAPKPDFAASTTSGPNPLTVQFTDTSKNSPTSWSWTFGDGATSTEQNPAHTYVTSGTYSVKLKVSNAKGTNGLTRSNYIVVSDPGVTPTVTPTTRPTTVPTTVVTTIPTTQPTTVPTTVVPVVSPKPDFLASITSGPNPLTVQFTDTSKNLPDSWSWTFGDSSTSTEQNPVHTYVTAGTYSVKLKVSNSKGTNGLTRSNYIVVS